MNKKNISLLLSIGILSSLPATTFGMFKSCCNQEKQAPICEYEVETYTQEGFTPAAQIPTITPQGASRTETPFFMDQEPKIINQDRLNLYAAKNPYKNQILSEKMDINEIDRKADEIYKTALQSFESWKAIEKHIETDASPERLKEPFFFIIFEMECCYQALRKTSHRFHTDEIYSKMCDINQTMHSHCWKRINQVYQTIQLINTNALSRMPTKTDLRNYLKEFELAIVLSYQTEKKILNNEPFQNDTKIEETIDAYNLLLEKYLQLQ